MNNTYLSDHENKTLLESDINLVIRKIKFLTDYKQINIAEMRLASLRYQLNQLMNRLDSQISI
jgi:hypothetical protein